MITDFLKPATLKETLEIRRSRKGVRYLAGGTWLNRNHTGTDETTIVSLEGLGLDRISSDETTSTLGAGVRLQQLIDAPEVPALIREAAGAVYSRNIRNMATLGGNIVAGGEDSALIPALLVLNAELKTAERGEIDLFSWLTDPADDLILSVTVPAIAKQTALRRLTRSAAGIPLLTVAAARIPSPEFPAGYIRAASNHQGSGWSRLDEIGRAVSGAIPAGRTELRSIIEANLDRSVVITDLPTGGSAYLRYMTVELLTEAIVDCIGGER